MDDAIRFCEEITQAMIYFVAVLAAVFGGLLARAWGFDSARRRLVAFLVPVCLCTGLVNTPLLWQVLHAGLPPLNWADLGAWSAFECFVLLAAVALTGLG